MKKIYTYGMQLLMIMSIADTALACSCKDNAENVFLDEEGMQDDTSASA